MNEMRNLGVPGLVLAPFLAGGCMAGGNAGEGFGPGSGAAGQERSSPQQPRGWHCMEFPVGAQPVTRDQAAQILQAHVRTVGNPILRVGGVTEFEAYYETQIVTKDGSFVEKVWVDKRSGWMRSVY